MNGPTTTITDPSSGEEKKFTFDYSYWSFDGYKEEKNGYCAPDSKHPNGKKFCDQAGKISVLSTGIPKMVLLCTQMREISSFPLLTVLVCLDPN